MNGKDWSFRCPRLGKRPHERPQPFALLDRLGSPVAIPEVSVLGTELRLSFVPASAAVDNIRRTSLSPPVITNPSRMYSATTIFRSGLRSSDTAHEKPTLKPTQPSPPKPRIWCSTISPMSFRTATRHRSSRPRAKRFPPWTGQANVTGPFTQSSHTVVILAIGVSAPRFLEMGYDAYCAGLLRREQPDGSWICLDDCGKHVGCRLVLMLSLLPRSGSP